MSIHLLIIDYLNGGVLGATEHCTSFDYTYVIYPNKHVGAVLPASYHQLAHGVNRDLTTSLRMCEIKVLEMDILWLNYQRKMVYFDNTFEASFSRFLANKEFSLISKLRLVCGPASFICLFIHICCCCYESRFYLFMAQLC